MEVAPHVDEVVGDGEVVGEGCGVGPVEGFYFAVVGLCDEPLCCELVGGVFLAGGLESGGVGVVVEGVVGGFVGEGAAVVDGAEVSA